MTTVGEVMSHTLLTAEPTTPLAQAAERRGQERDEPGVLLGASQPAQRHRAGGALLHGLGVLLNRVGLEVAGGDRVQLDVEARPLDR